MSIGLAVFVKTSALSPVKTRLAAAIGPESALAVYRASVACVRESVSQASTRCSLQPYWAVAEAEGAASWGEWPVLVQPEGDLGTRMCAVYEALLQRHQGAILLGADAPAINAWQIADACNALEHDLARVISLAEDGGFVLFGSNADLSHYDWSSVPYGAPDTAMRFLDQVGPGLPLVQLESHYDLDTVHDLQRLAQRPPTKPTLAQQRFWQQIPEWLTHRR
jgi:uncharacterized protein